jgi:VIT1/CCC1 family predicted Fe2+/Mn2+ transporter
VTALRGGAPRAVAMGVADGVLTALLLASGRLLGPGEIVDGSLAVRVALGAMATGAFVFYVGRYADLRSRLIRAERQLNLASRGKLATTHLGRAVLGEAVRESAVSGASSFAGALVPLLLGAVTRAVPAVAVGVPIAILAAMGLVLARVVAGSPLVWAGGLVAGGIAMAALGWKLHLV